ncbi:MAG: tRNA (adenosine(37)-N6)-threonylcarbamoyltransferase complex dimerization subunit type 1 TsaB [Cardiobacteriaceae bacterium]|nr:tRNA (adenosine(37)-N6)-threonylcarbamoyltransferase complex dimerization subunit type 1 TsaB [Cardiobacteriaceae bacterium]
MNHLLAIDTSTPACSVALLSNTKRFEAFETKASKHTEILLPMIESLLQQAHLKPHELEGIIISIGPGAFTGLRVGASVAMGLAYGAGAKLLPISSLALQAQTAMRLTGQSFIISTLDARMDEIYAGIYQHGKALSPDTLLSPKALWQRWQTDYAEALIVGSGLHYPPFNQSALPTDAATLVPQAVDAFDWLQQNPTDALWQSPSNGLILNYLRNDVVDKPKIS